MRGLVSGFWFRVSGFWFLVLSFLFRVSGLAVVGVPAAVFYVRIWYIVGVFGKWRSGPMKMQNAESKTDMPAFMGLCIRA